MGGKKHHKASKVRIPVDYGSATLIVRQKCEKLIADHPELAGIITEKLEERIVNRLLFLCCRWDDQNSPARREALLWEVFGIIKLRVKGLSLR